MSLFLLCICIALCCIFVFCWPYNWHLCCEARTLINTYWIELSYYYHHILRFSELQQKVATIEDVFGSVVLFTSAEITLQIAGSRRAHIYTVNKYNRNLHVFPELYKLFTLRVFDKVHS